MTTQHTPGPWKSEQLRQHDHKIQIWGEDGLIAETSTLNSKSQANARLIASAPELLKLLQEVVSAPPEGWSVQDGINLSERCKDAIAKATGA